MRYLKALLALAVTSLPLIGVVSTASAQTTYTLNVTDDTYGTAGTGFNTVNYGGASKLYVDQLPNQQRTYLKFHVTQTGITSATLNLNAEVANSTGVVVRAIPSTWSEGTLTASNAPAPVGTCKTQGAFSAGTLSMTINLTNCPVAAGDVSFAVTYRDDNQVAFTSKEGDPNLAATLTVVGDDPVQPPSNTVVWAVGDMCDPSNRTPGCEGVTNLILNDVDADAFIPLGDLQYENGTTSEFSTYYHQKVGQYLNSITHPALGNHEYGNGSNPTADGYFAEFPTGFGGPTTGWYDWQIGGWEMVATNTQCTYTTGCGASTPQGLFVKSALDKAAAAGKCSLVYGHFPPISDGSSAPGNSTQRNNTMSWAYARGAELMLSGHDHGYQRFPEMDSTATAVTSGVRPIVVGTGGEDLTTFTTTNRSDYRQGSEFGALRLVLGSSGYTGEYYNFAGQVLDSFSGTCH